MKSIEKRIEKIEKRQGVPQLKKTIEEVRIYVDQKRIEYNSPEEKKKREEGYKKMHEEGKRR